MHFLISSLIWFLAFLPMVLLSFVAVPFLLLTKWDGTTTWFGNWKYGRGDDHYKAPSKGVFWKQWQFLCIRNPVSNFGKFTLSTGPDNEWAWLVDRRFGRVGILYGWKNPDSRLPGSRRPFVFRPYIGGR